MTPHSVVQFEGGRWLYIGRLPLDYHLIAPLEPYLAAKYGRADKPPYRVVKLEDLVTTGSVRNPEHEPQPPEVADEPDRLW